MCCVSQLAWLSSWGSRSYCQSSFGGCLRVTRQHQPNLPPNWRSSYTGSESPLCGGHSVHSITFSMLLTVQRESMSASLCKRSFMRYMTLPTRSLVCTISVHFWVENVVWIVIDYSCWIKLFRNTAPKENRLWISLCTPHLIAVNLPTWMYHFLMDFLCMTCVQVFNLHCSF
jgi:hypothetical protein